MSTFVYTKEISFELVVLVAGVVLHLLLLLPEEILGLLGGRGGLDISSLAGLAQLLGGRCGGLGNVDTEAFLRLRYHGHLV